MPFSNVSAGHIANVTKYTEAKYISTKQTAIAKTGKAKAGFVNVCKSVNF